jgi:hypothetical protein
LIILRKFSQYIIIQIRKRIKASKEIKSMYKGLMLCTQKVNQALAVQMNGVMMIQVFMKNKIIGVFPKAIRSVIFIAVIVDKIIMSPIAKREISQF